MMRKKSDVARLDSLEMKNAYTLRWRRNSAESFKQRLNGVCFSCNREKQRSLQWKGEREEGNE